MSFAKKVFAKDENKLKYLFMGMNNFNFALDMLKIGDFYTNF